MVTTKIYIVRHGETYENSKKIVQGQMDTLMNEVGIEQVNLVAAALRAIPFDVAYSSDLSRASKVCSILIGGHLILILTATDGRDHSGISSRYTTS